MRKAKPAILRTYFDLAPFLPSPIPRRQWLRLSELGKAPAYTRPAGFKSEPVFLEQDFIIWVKQTYGKLLPEYVASLENDGLSAKPFSVRKL